MNPMLHYTVGINRGFSPLENNEITHQKNFSKQKKEEPAESSTKMFQICEFWVL